MEWVEKWRAAVAGCWGFGECCALSINIPGSGREWGMNACVTGNGDGQVLRFFSLFSHRVRKRGLL